MVDMMLDRMKWGSVQRTMDLRRLTHRRCRETGDAIRLRKSDAAPPRMGHRLHHEQYGKRREDDEQPQQESSDERTGLAHDAQRGDGIGLRQAHPL